MPEPVQLLLSIESIGDKSRLTVEEGRGMLSADEIQRAAAFRFDLHRDRYIRGRALLRQKIADLVKADPRDLEFATESRGKPYLRHGGPSFNLSHSGDTAVFAFCRHPVAIGVDVEELDRRGSFADISAHYFTSGERAHLAQFSGELWRRQFLQIWTAKEARMKIYGEGLSLDPRKIDLLFTNGQPAGYRSPQPAHLFLAVQELFMDSGNSNFETRISKAVVSVAAEVPFRIESDDLAFCMNPLHSD